MPPQKLHVLTSAPDWKPQAVLLCTAAHRLLQSDDCTTFIQIQSDETWLQLHSVCISHTSQSGRPVLCRKERSILNPRKRRRFTASRWLKKWIKSCTNLSCIQCCWDRRQRSAVRAVPARTARSSSRCWCKCCGCGRTCPSTWRTVTGSTWAWWQRRWWRLCPRLPWFCGFYSLPVENL